MYKKWLYSKTDKALAVSLAECCDIDPMAALIASSRGYRTEYEIEEFFSEELLLSSPYELSGMEAAAEIINSCINTGKKIAVYGDYDCDGVTATVLVFKYLCSRGADAVFVIPSREDDGYGLNSARVDEMHQMGVELIITVDNGIAAADEIEYAMALGLQVVVTDHHIPGEVIPKASAVVDPLLSQNDVFKGFSGVGVAFKVICAVDGSAPEELIWSFGDLVALGTVADVMPITDENRSLVRAGLEIINHSPSKGLRALINCACLEGKKITEDNIAFMLAPRINAAGRMGSAERAAELLLTENYDEAVRLAEEINLENINRQNVEKEIFEEASKIIERENMQFDPIIVVGGDGWHSGVAGIAAAKLVAKYSRPCIVLSVNGEEAHGSGRSLEGFSLYDAISYASEFTEKFGGHKLAAGVSLKRENISAFRNKLIEYADSVEMPFPTLQIDCKLNPQGLTLDMVDSIDTLRPFGNGNPSPIFAVCGVTLSDISVIGGGKHLRLGFTKNGAAFKALYFKHTAESLALSVGDLADIVITLDRNVYNGNESLSIIIKDIRAADLNEAVAEHNIRLYENFKRQKYGAAEAKELLPTRETLGKVYNVIRACGSVTAEKAENLLKRNLGGAKILICLEILEELNLITAKKSGDYTVYCLNAGAEKTDMQNSKTYKTLIDKSEALI